MPHLKINNTAFYYELSGKGQPLVLISGYAADHFFWQPILAEMEKHFQVLIFDHRAIGQTQDGDTFPLTAQIMADDIMNLVKALGLKKPHIVGQSMGGTIAQNIAVRYPDEISKLVILNSTLKWRQAMLLGLKSMLNVQRENGSFDTVFELILSWVYGEAFLNNPTQVEFLRSVFLNNPYPQSLANQERQYAALVEFDGRNHASQIKADTLVVSGLEDVISLPAESKEIAESIPHAKLVELQCGHGITGEMPKELSQILTQFLR